MLIFNNNIIFCTTVYITLAKGLLLLNYIISALIAPGTMILFVPFYLGDCIYVFLRANLCDRVAYNLFFKSNQIKTRYFNLVSNDKSDGSLNLFEFSFEWKQTFMLFYWLLLFYRLLLL